MISPFQLDLGDVQLRLYNKYDVSDRDGELAIVYLRSFLHAKNVNPGMPIILPQIADWAWHELILDTVRYRQICSMVFGNFLHHVATDIDDLLPFKRSNSAENTIKARNAFINSQTMFRNEYGLKPSDFSDQWRLAGWETPLYRLRNSIDFQLMHSFLDECDSSNNFRPVVPDFLSWLPSRIIRRFGMSTLCANHLVSEYARQFVALQNDQNLHLSNLCNIAAQEHVLWTKKYAEDCNQIYRRFVDYESYNFFGIQQTDVVLSPVVLPNADLKVAAL